MTSAVFFFLHGALLFAALAICRVYKLIILADGLAAGEWALLLFQDVTAVCALEFGMLALMAPATGKRTRKLMHILWALSLIPLLFIIVIEQRYFLSTHSFLNAQLLWYGIKQAPHMLDAYHDESGWIWWMALGGVLLTAYYFVKLAVFADSAAYGFRRFLGFTVLAASACAVTLYGAPLDAARSVLAALLVDTVSASAGIETARARAIPEPVAALRVTSGAPQHDIVVVILESVRADATSLYNRELDTTPFLTELGKQALVVEYAYSLLPHTSKAIVSIVCGFPPNFHFALAETQRGGLPPFCLPHLLHPLGYRSAFLQSANPGFENRANLVTNFGYEHFVSLPDLDSKRFAKVNYFGLEERAILDPLWAWIEKSDKPYVATLLTMSSHHNFQVPAYFQKKTYPGDKQLSDYLNTVRFQDTFLKELFDGFRSRGRLERTIFVITGDHGQAFDEHKLRGQNNVLYNESVRVPLLFLIPGQQPRVEREHYASHLDIAPTIYAALGAAPQSGSFWGSSLIGASNSGRRHILTCWDTEECMAQVRDGHKFMYNFRKESAEYYDQREDRFERIDRAGTVTESARAEQIAYLKSYKNTVRGFYKRYAPAERREYVFDEAPVPRAPMLVDFDKKMRLVGFDPPAGRTSAGRYRLQLYFHSKANTWNWRPSARVEHEDGTRIPALLSSTLIGKHPFAGWIPGEYVRVEYTFSLPRGQLTDSLRLAFGILNSKGEPVTARAVDPRLVKSNEVLISLFS